MYGGEGGEECGGKVGEMKVENGKWKMENRLQQGSHQLFFHSPLSIFIFPFSKTIT